MRDPRPCTHRFRLPSDANQTVPMVSAPGCLSSNKCAALRYASRSWLTCKYFGPDGRAMWARMAATATGRCQGGRHHGVQVGHTCRRLAVVTHARIRHSTADSAPHVCVCDPHGPLFGTQATAMRITACATARLTRGWGGFQRRRGRRLTRRPSR